jgi:YidC/Oxa1 family membrane protein insertase
VAFAFIAPPVNSSLFEEVFMNDIRRTFLWVIFGFSMVLLWDQWQIYNGQKATFFPKPVVANAENTAASSTPAAASSVPTASSSATSTAAGPSEVPSSSAASNAPTTSRERIDVSTDVLKLRFDTEGGTLLFAEFLKFGDLVDSKKPFVLLDESKARVYVAQTGLIGRRVCIAQNPHEIHRGKHPERGKKRIGS